MRFSCGPRFADCRPATPRRLPRPSTRPSRRAAAHRRRRFPFPVTEKTLPNGLRVYVVNFDSPGLVAVLLGRPHRQPQRGRARQVGLRPLLRAHDVPRHASVSDRGLQRRHQGDRRRLERLHVRRPDRVSHPRRQGGAAQDRRDRGRPLPAPQVPGGRVPEGSARRAGRIQQERLEPDREDGRGAVRQRLHHAHVQAHDDGLPEGHRGHAQRVRLFAAVLRPLLPARQRRRCWWSATPTPRPCSSWSSRSYGGWKAGSKRPAGARRAAAEEGEARRPELEGRRRCPCCSRATTSPRFSTTNVDLPALDVLAELLFAERAPLYKKLVITEQKVESLSGSADAHVDPNLFTVLARMKKPDDLAYVEKAIHDEMARIAQGRRRRQDAGRRAVAREVRLRRRSCRPPTRRRTRRRTFIALTGELRRSTRTSRCSTR